jgi:hypothetical protein
MSSDHSKHRPNAGPPTDDVSGGALAVGPDGEPLDDHGAPLDPHDEGSDPLADPLTGDEEPEPLTAPPIAVAELAAACVRFVATRYGVMLDFEPDTLSLVDQWIVDARKEMPENPQSQDLVQSAAGAYLGEVIRRAFGGMWFADGDHDGWRLDLSRVYLTFNPLGMMREALFLESQEGWHAHLEMDPGEREEVLRRLEALPGVGDEEYFAPTTRFDVVHIAYDALRAKMSAAGLGDVRFGPEDYKK